MIESALKSGNPVIPYTRASRSSWRGKGAATGLKGHFPERFQALSSMPLY